MFIIKKHIQKKKHKSEGSSVTNNKFHHHRSSFIGPFIGHSFIGHKKKGEERIHYWEIKNEVTILWNEVVKIRYPINKKWICNRHHKGLTPK